MTLEFSLRVRARKCRRLSLLWSATASVVLVLACISVVGLTVKYVSWSWAQQAATAVLAASASDSAPQSALKVIAEKAGDDAFRNVAVIVAALLFLIIVAYGLYILVRLALQESFLAMRYDGLADAICVGGATLSDFEKAAAIFVPKSKDMGRGDVFSSKDVRIISDFIKAAKSA